MKTALLSFIPFAIMVTSFWLGFKGGDFKWLLIPAGLLGGFSWRMTFEYFYLRKEVCKN